MNERIQQMIFGFNEKVGVHWTHEDKIKFAQLIVQECVNVLHDNELWNRHISHALNEHFGV